MYTEMIYKNTLYHHGILGMKWGVRRYQNEDGTLTEAGKKRYINTIGQNDTISVRERRAGKLQKLITKKDTTGMYEIRNKNNDDLMGHMFVDDHGDHDYIDFMGMEDKYIHKGYGQQALNIYFDYCKKKGKKYIDLDAAETDPASRAVAYKLGFEAIGNAIGDELWGSLLPMRKKLQ